VTCTSTARFPARLWRFCPDDFYRKTFEKLVAQWKKAANESPDEPDSKVSKDG
jgi:hypothetical protein